MRSIGADEVAALGPAAAIEAITGALRDGLDPAADPARTSVDLANGQFLLMASQSAHAVGVKIVSVAPGNPARGLPRIHAAYLLFDHGTLTLRAMIDGAALTELRTGAVSVAAVHRRLADRPLRVAVFGAGPQAIGHVNALAAVRPLGQVTHIVRNPPGAPVPAVEVGSADAATVLRSADVVVCATTARTPLFDSSVLRGDVVVVAVGSHERDARELDAALLARSQVVVEDPAAALREAGDVVSAVDEGAVTPADLIPMADAVSGAVHLDDDRPVVFKGVGMAWQDLVVAEAVLRHDESRA